MGRSENVDDLASAPSEHGPDAAGSTAPAIDEPAAAIRQPGATRSRDTPRPDDPDGHDDARRPTAPPDPGPGKNPRAAGGILAPAKIALILAGVIQGMISVLQVVPFILLARIAQMFLSGAPRESFVTTGVWAVVIMTVTTLGVSALMIALHFYDAHFSAALRRRLMDKLSRLPLGWFSGRGSGEVKRLVGDDVTALHYVIVHSVTDIVAAAVAPVTVLVYLFAVEWRLALVMLLPIAAYIQVMLRISRRDSAKAMEAQNQIGRASSAMQTFIATHEVSRVYGDRAIIDIDSVLNSQGDFITDWQRDTGPTKIVAVMINRPPACSESSYSPDSRCSSPGGSRLLISSPSSSSERRSEDSCWGSRWQRTAWFRRSNPKQDSNRCSTRPSCPTVPSATPRKATWRSTGSGSDTAPTATY